MRLNSFRTSLVDVLFPMIFLSKLTYVHVPELLCYIVPENFGLLCTLCTFNVNISRAHYDINSTDRDQND